MFDNVPEIADKYDSFEHLSDGGQGSLYRARHKILDEVRVIKTIHAGTEFEDAKARFVREAQIAAKLRHPHIATVHDFLLSDDGSAYLIMEYIDGVNLWELYKSGKRLGLPLVGLAAQQLLDALDYLHTQRFIHRDIALDNVMMRKGLRGDYNFTLIDLGIAKSLESNDYRTRTGIALGKVLYISPEALKHGSASSEVDERSDLYSFGVVLYQLLTGKLPIQGTDQTSLIAGHLYQAPRTFEETDPDGKLDDYVRTALLRSIEKEPADRYQSASEMRSELSLVIPAPDNRDLGEIGTGSRRLDDQTEGEDRPRPSVDVGTHTKAPPVPEAPQAAPKPPIRPPVAEEAASGTVLKGTRRMPLRAGLVAAVVTLLVVGWFAIGALGGEKGTDVATNSTSGTAGAADRVGGGAALPVFGNFHALIIGNDRYDKLPGLATAVNDARTLGEVLERQYGFNVKVVENTSLDDFNAALYELEQTMTARDNLLVYYAGHGQLYNNKPYWQPTDAEPTMAGTWISIVDAVNPRLDDLPVRHLLVVADSCFAGTDNGDLPPSEAPLEEQAKRVSRLVMTSGDIQPVPDDSGSGHSVFAQELMERLRDNDGVLAAQDLFGEVAPRVVEVSERLEAPQYPTFTALPRSADEGGMFYFVPRSKNAAGS